MKAKMKGQSVPAKRIGRWNKAEKKGGQDTPRKRARTVRCYITPESLRTWKDFLASAIKPELTPPSDEMLDSVMARFAVASEVELAQELPDFFREVVRSFPENPELQAGAFLLCCRVLDVSPVIHGREAISLALVPRRNSLEYEYILHDLLVLLRDEAKIAGSLEIYEGVTFLKWLQQLAKFIQDNSLPVPVTAITVQCVADLLDVSPLSVEPIIGQLCAVLIYNIDHVDVNAFWEHVLKTFVKLRQIPKLIAKLLIAVCKNEELKVVPLARPICEKFADVVSQLPTGQVLELWKTFLYHLEHDCFEEKLSATAKNLFCVINQLMAEFFRNICVIDHTVPQSTVEKICELVKQTQENVVSKLRKEEMTDMRKQFVELSIVLAVNRNLKFSEILGQNHQDMVLRFKIAVVNGEDIDFENLALNPEDIISNALIYRCEDKKVLSIAKHLVLKEPDGLSDLLRKSPLLQESEKLQTGVVISVLKYLNDVLDVDGTCEEIFRPFGKDPLKLFNLESPKVLEKVRKSFDLLEVSMTGDRTNPELDAKFYFHVPLNALEILPLESVHPTLNLYILIVTFSLLSVSAHEDVNERLFVVLARSLDPTFRQSNLSRTANGAKILAWLSRLRYYQEGKFVGQAQKFLSQSIVKFIHEFSDVWPQFSDTLKKLTPALQSLENEKAAMTAVIFMEALEKPLTFLDATEEKLKMCEKLFNKFTKNLLECLNDISENSQYKQLLVTRALSSVFVVWNAKSAYKFTLKEKWLLGIRTVTTFALDHLQGPESFSSRLVMAALRLHDPMKQCVDRHFKDKLWNIITDLKSQLLDFESLVICLLEKSSLKELTKQLGKLIVPEVLCNGITIVEYIRLTEILRCFAIANLSEDKEPFRQTLLETSMPSLQSICDSDTSYDKSNIDRKNSLMALQLTLLRAKKPLLFRESEARCLATCLQVNLEDVLVRSPPECFQDTWEAMYEILSAAFLHRANTLVIPRISVVLSVFRNLLAGLTKASDQRRSLVPTELKKLVIFAHNLDRILDHIRKQKEDFARVSPYIIADILHCFQRVTIYPEVKTNLTFGIHKLLDICDKHSKEFLAGTLPEGTREIYKHILENYNQYFKYTGRV